MMRKRFRRRGRGWTSESGRKAALSRWKTRSDERAGEPIRRSRVVVLTIRDSHRPMMTVRLQCEPIDHGWSRFSVWQGAERIGNRRYGRTAVARLIAEALR